MKDRNGQNGRRKSRSNASNIGRVRVFSKPGPDAEDRLRRLFALVVRYATEDGQDASEEASRADEPHAKDHDKADA